jgi:hypothetical protein
MTDLLPDSAARALAAQLFDRLTLDASGAPFEDGDPDAWQSADAAEPEIVQLGQVRFQIVDTDATDLALAVGAIQGPEALLCVVVEFEAAEGGPEPAIGQYVILPTEVPGISVTFVIWTTHEDLHDSAAPDLGANAVCIDVLNALQPRQALLIQVVDVEGEDV